MIVLGWHDTDRAAFLAILAPAVSSAANIVVTVLIAVRIMWSYRQMGGILPEEQLGNYNLKSAVAIIVESAALTAIATVVYIITLALGSPIEQITASILCAIPVCILNAILLFLYSHSSQSIATYLVVLRINLGRSIRVEETVKLTTMASQSREAQDDYPELEVPGVGEPFDIMHFPVVQKPQADVVHVE